MSARSPLEFSPGAAGPVLRLAPVADPRDAVWQDFAACAQAGGDFWYPEQGEGTCALTAVAKRICAACPVRPECLDFALGHMRHTLDAGMYGIWAGTTVNERKQMLREAA
jgi:WhiB family redox-sensing transcriptional regulator